MTKRLPKGMRKRMTKKRGCERARLLAHRNWLLVSMRSEMPHIDFTHDAVLNGDTVWA